MDVGTTSNCRCRFNCWRVHQRLTQHQDAGRQTNRSVRLGPRVAGHGSFLSTALIFDSVKRQLRTHRRGHLTRPVLPRIYTEWLTECSRSSPGDPMGARRYAVGRLLVVGAPSMVLSDFGRRPGGFDYHITATDLSSRMLDTALKAVYRAEAASNVPPELRERYLLRSRDRSDGRVRVVPAIRRRVSFGRLNLLDPLGFDVPFDAMSSAATFSSISTGRHRSTSWGGWPVRWSKVATCSWATPKRCMGWTFRCDTWLPRSIPRSPE
jgi:hypothetical protein